MPEYLISFSHWCQLLTFPQNLSRYEGHASEVKKIWTIQLKQSSNHWITDDDPHSAVRIYFRDIVNTILYVHYHVDAYFCPMGDKLSLKSSTLFGVCMITYEHRTFWPISLSFCETNFRWYRQRLLACVNIERSWVTLTNILFRCETNFLWYHQHCFVCAWSGLWVRWCRG